MQKAKRYLIIAGIVVAVLLIIGIILASIYNAWLVILYISLIIVAAFTLFGTAARFTSDFAVEPTVRAASLLLAAQHMIRVFLGRGHAGSRFDQRRRQQMDAIYGGE